LPAITALSRASPLLDYPGNRDEEKDSLRRTALASLRAETPQPIEGEQIATAGPAPDDFSGHATGLAIPPRFAQFT